MDLGYFWNLPRGVSPRLDWGHAQALFSRAVAAVSHSLRVDQEICGFPSRLSHKDFPRGFPTGLSDEAFPRGFPTGLSHVPPVEYIMRNSGLDEAQAGIKIAGININSLRYTDDTTHMAESEEELKQPLDESERGE